MPAKHAVRIYDGQLAVFDKIPGMEKTAELVRHMAQQEEAHFDNLIVERNVRPTAFGLYGIWLLRWALPRRWVKKRLWPARPPSRLKLRITRRNMTNWPMALMMRCAKMTNFARRSGASRNGYRTGRRRDTGLRSHELWLIRLGCRIAIRASEKI